MEAGVDRLLPALELQPGLGQFQAGNLQRFGGRELSDRILEYQGGFMRAVQSAVGGCDLNARCGCEHFAAAECVQLLSELSGLGLHCCGCGPSLFESGKTLPLHMQQTLRRRYMRKAGKRLGRFLLLKQLGPGLE
jgi:hypothetical protein